MTQETVVIPPNPGGGDASYRLTIMVPRRRFLSYLRDRWWVVMVCLALAVGTAVTYETVRMETYNSYTELLVGDIQVNMANLITEDSLNYFGTQIELLKSSRLQSAAYKAAPGTVITEKNRVKMQVVRPMGTATLQLQATGGDPALTQDFLRELIAEYRAFKSETRNSSSAELMKSLTEQQDLQKSILETNQNLWVEFQKTNNLAVLEEEGRIRGLYLAEQKLDLDKFNLERELLQKEIESAGTNTDSLATPGAAGGVQPSAADLAAAVAALLTTNAAGGAGSNAASQPSPNGTKFTVRPDDTELRTAKIALRQMLADEGNL